jgi:hypothetical protein
MAVRVHRPHVARKTALHAACRSDDAKRPAGKTRVHGVCSGFSVGSGTEAENGAPAGGLRKPATSRSLDSHSALFEAGSRVEGRRLEAFGLRHHCRHSPGRGCAGVEVRLQRLKRQNRILRFGIVSYRTQDFAPAATSEHRPYANEKPSAQKLKASRPTLSPRAPAELLYTRISGTARAGAFNHIHSRHRGTFSRRRTESTSVTREINPAEYEAENHACAWDNFRQQPHVASTQRHDR